MKRAPFASILALLAALASSCCKSSEKPNVLIVMIDTLRADRVGVYGGGKLTPFLDSLAARGHVFRHAYAQSSWTNPSIASLFTSRYQSQHRITWFDSVLSADEVTLAEVLREHGYATGGFSANPLVQGKSGYDQGFDAYQTYARKEIGALGEPILIKERAEKVSDESLAWLDSLGRDGGARKPIFLYAHYMEPHNPFDPPDAILDRVLAGRPRPDRKEVNESMALATVIEFEDELLQGVRDLYDAEVASLDAHLKGFFAALAERRFLDNALVVITADHGEELREHGRVGHERTLYEEVIRIPMIVLLPGQTERVDVDAGVMTVDVAPTLLDLAGIPRPASFEGATWKEMLARRGWWPGSLVAPPRPAAPDDRALLSQLVRSREQASQSPHEHALVRAGRKFIRGIGGEEEFYDLVADPREKRPNAFDPDARGALASALRTFLEAIGKRAAPGSVRTLDEETKERMRALGYHD